MINILIFKYNITFIIIMNKATYSFQPDIIDLRKIDAIVADIDRYGNREQFIRESLDLMILWWTNPATVQDRTSEMWKDFTPAMKDNLKNIAPTFYDAMESANSGSQSTKSQGSSFLLELNNEIKISRNFLKDEKFPVCKECITNNNPPLMNKLHTRFFPSKVVISLLANLIRDRLKEDNTQWVSYEEFRGDVFQDVLEISKVTKSFEDKNGIQRNKRISTGLPIFHEKTFENKDDELKNLNRIESSKERFLDQFVGPTLRSWKHGDGTIGGILNDMGLVYFRKADDSSLEITLSKLGLQFFISENPILDNQDFTHSISSEEKEFVLEYVIPRLDLEKRIVDSILGQINKLAKDESLNTENVDSTIDMVKSKWFADKRNASIAEELKIPRADIAFWQNVRISTMGRLSETGAVNWLIEKGFSKYVKPKTLKKAQIANQ